jgi:ferredoxin
LSIEHRRLALHFGKVSLKLNVETKMAKEVYVDKEECTGCSQCADDLPDVFRMDDDDLTEVHNSNGASEEEIQEEIEACPGECIHWKE